MIISIFIVFSLLGSYYIWTARQTRHRLVQHGTLSVSYLFQEYPGQYSGDRSIKSGVVVIHTSSHDKKLKQAKIQHVVLKHPDLQIQLQQSLSLSFHYEGQTNSEVSIRYKVIRKGMHTLDLTGVRTSITGTLHFEGGYIKPFKVVVPISGRYQQKKGQEFLPEPED